MPSQSLPQSIIKAEVKQIFDQEFGESEWDSADFIISKESRWNPHAINKTSGACSLFQFLPCSKLKCELQDIKCQAHAGASYIKNRYGTPSNAYNFWQIHRWY